MRFAATVLEPAIVDIEANLEASERLMAAAVSEGAQLAALPEFFTTSATFDPRLAVESVRHARTDARRETSLSRSPSRSESSR